MSSFVSDTSHYGHRLRDVVFISQLKGPGMGLRLKPRPTVFEAEATK